MKIILLSDVYNHGVAGEVVEVANGFARNYLIPKGLATKATDGELKRFSKMREKSEARRMEYEGKLNELGHKINGTNLVFFRRAASTGKLFGSVTTQDIAEELDRITGVDINRRRVSQQSLRDTGLYGVPVRLGSDASPVLNVRIISEDQRVEYQRQLDAIGEGLIEEIRFTESGNVVPVDLNKLRQRIERAEAQAEAESEIETATAAATPEDEETAVPATEAAPNTEE